MSPDFRYRAKSASGENISGTINAGNPEEAVEQISHDGYFPVSVEQIDHSSDTRRREMVRGRVRLRDITSFSRQISSLLKAGISILQALNVIAEQSENPALRNMLRNIAGEVREGASFSSALARHNKVFSPLYIAIVRAGESSGTMDVSLSRMADYLRKQNQLISKVRMALVYPVFMLVVGIATMVFMLVYVLPRLTGIFVTTGQELPLPTQIVVGVSEWFRAYWVWAVGGAVGAFVIARRSLVTDAGRTAWDNLKLRMPVLGKFFLKVELARFSRTMEILIKSGIPILETIRTASSVFGNKLIRNELAQACSNLEQGASFGRSLKRSPFFPLFMSNLVTVGEESGRLDESLAEIADSYERDTEEAITTSTALLEPLMILVVGSVIGFIVIAMLLPVFQIDLMAGM